jgi:release factor glutamine methyltransferase
LARVLHFKKIELYTKIDRPVSHNEREQFRKLIQKRLLGEPVAYLINEKYWHDLSLYVDQRVLIPRPETESLLDFVIQEMSLFIKEPKLIYDFCTGSGCLAVALAKKFPTAQVIAVDVSEEALQVTAHNALKNQVQNVLCKKGDLLQDLCYRNLFLEYGSADLIITNPPYVSEKEWDTLHVSVKNFEPKMALVSGQEGLEFGFKIVENIFQFQLLKENSLFAMELAEKQPQKIKSEIRKILSFHYPAWEYPKNEWFALCDLENKARFLVKIFKKLL